MQPIDYMTQVRQPFQAALQGYQAGAAIRDDQQQQQALALQAQQRQAALLAQQQMQQEVAALSSNPSATAKDYAALVMKYPSLREPAKQSWEMVSQDRRAGVQEMLTRAYAATSSGRPDIAQNILRERAAAMRNSGDEAGAKSMEQSAELIGQDPVQARYQIGTFLAGIMEPDKFAETFAKLGAEGRAAELQGPAVREANAKATTAEVTARFAEPTAAADLTKKEADAQKAAVAAKFAESQAVADLKLNAAQIAKMAADTEILRMNARIAAMNAQTSREGNDLKLRELQLKIEEATSKRDAAVREKVATAESGAASIDNMLNTIERIKANPNLNDVLGGIEGRMPAVADASVDAIALIETLGSQAFLAQIPNIKGMGALSNAEGEKLQSALQNLARTQSEKQFRANLEEAGRLLLKGRKNIERSTGVTLGKPDTPAKPTAPAGNVTVSGW
ncbi:MAG: hypothetical protein MUC68_10360 [Burkholderiaceae bacterium]|jgi:hypothetical protein|nr:hypothetical protein [Burkholderiaceae bacterium]